MAKMSPNTVASIGALQSGASAEALHPCRQRLGGARGALLALAFELTPLNRRLRAADCQLLVGVRGLDVLLRIERLRHLDSRLVQLDERPQGLGLRLDGAVKCLDVRLSSPDCSRIVGRRLRTRECQQRRNVVRVCVCRFQGCDVLISVLALDHEIRAAPREPVAAKLHDQRICHQPRMSPVAVYKGVDSDESVMETYANLIRLERPVLYPMPNII